MKRLLVILLAAGLACLAAGDGKARDLSRSSRVLATIGGDYRINLQFRENEAIYTGSSTFLRQTLQRSAAQPLALASEDFDKDGTPDLVTGYVASGRGIVTLQRGNVDSVFPNTGAAQKRKAKGVFTDAPFLPAARVFEVPEVPEFLGAGDFDGDGHTDVIAAARGSDRMYLLSGDGHGALHTARELKLAGNVTALAVGEINRNDGLPDLVLGITNRDGPKLLVYESLSGAVRATPEILPLPGEATALQLGSLDSHYATDVAAAAGNTVVIVHGRDRRLSQSELRQKEVPPARIEELHFPFIVTSIAIGDFIWDRNHRAEMALLGEDGTIHLLQRGKLDTRPFGADTALESAATSSPDDDDTWTAASESISLPQSLARSPSHSRKILVRGNVSGVPVDDLLLADSSNNQLHILGTRANSKRTGNALSAKNSRRITTIDIKGGAPIAVLPMRLNKDALNDLVILKEGSSQALLVQSVPNLIITVNTTAWEDKRDNKLTLREAMQIVNVDCGVQGEVDGEQGCLNRLTSEERQFIDGHPGTGLDEIRFVIGSGVQRIVPTGEVNRLLIRYPVTIDGTFQPEYADHDTPLIVLSGENAQGGVSGITVQADNSTLRALVIERWAGGAGIEISIGSFNKIEGNFIGTDETGTPAFTPTQNLGIDIINSNGNTIGGSAPPGPQGQQDFAPFVGNLISSNASFGIQVRQVHDGEPNLVKGNFVGNNAKAGISISHSRKTFVGISRLDGPNLIANNGTHGIQIATDTHLGSVDNVIRGNRIRENAGPGVSLFADNNTVGGSRSSGFGNEIVGNGGSGIQLSGSQVAFNNIQGNFIGVFENGGSRPNAQNGVLIDNAPDNFIGNAHLDTDLANIISRNGAHGVEIFGPLASENEVQHNFIGTDVTGLLKMGNQLNGVDIQDAPNNTIGGTQDAGNVIADNNAGIQISGLTAIGNKVHGNRIGTDWDAKIDLGNRGPGVVISNAPDNEVGSVLSIEFGNTIVWNLSGIQISGTEARRNRVCNNWIGTNSNSLADMGNRFVGITIFDAPDNIIGGADGFQNIVGWSSIGVGITGVHATGNKVQGNAFIYNSLGAVISDHASNNMIGGDFVENRVILRFPGNIFAQSAGAAVVVSSGIGNTIQSNEFRDNGGISIDLGGDGVTQNDGTGDPDQGPNQLQNFPEVNKAELSPNGSTEKITGRLQSSFPANFKLQFYVALQCHVSGYGPGLSTFSLLSEMTVSTAVGAIDFSGTFPTSTVIGGVHLGQFITATATNLATGDTSEFSKCSQIVQLDTDGDGVSDAEEMLAANGDNNADGMPDWTQPNVVTMQVNGVLVSLTAAEAATILHASSVANPSSGNPPGTINGFADFPLNFFEFVVHYVPPVSSIIPTALAAPDPVKSNAQVPQTATMVTLSLPPGILVDTYYNYGPEPGNPVDHWYPFLYDGFTGAELKPDRVVLHFIDGERGDHDLAVNGQIAVRGGPALIQPTCTISPSTASSVAGSSYSLNATVRVGGVPRPNVGVLFTITSGPNSTLTPFFKGTDPSGKAEYTYKGSTTPGTDTIQASGEIAGLEFSCTALKTWIPVDQHVDLSLTNVVSPNPVPAGGNLTYILTVSNAGPDPALNVDVTDKLPAALSVVSCLATGGGCFAPDNNVTASFQSIPVGGQAVVTIVAKVGSNVAAGTTVSNTASVAGTAMDDVPANNSTTASSTVNTQSDLTLSKSGSPGFVKPGANITYVINANNDGPSDSGNVIVTDNLPADVNFVSCSSTHGGVCGGSGNNRTVSFTSLPAGTRPAITIVATALSTLANGAPILNTAVISGNTPDPATANNSSTATVKVEVPSGNPDDADVSVVATDSPDPVIAGQNVTYTITVSNAGPGQGLAVHVTDNLPPQVTFVSCNISGTNLCGGSGNVASATIKSLAPGASATLTVVALVHADVLDGSVIINTVSLQSESQDSIKSNNSATTSTTVNRPPGQPKADLSVSKADSPDPVFAGGNILYAIAISNAGPDAASSVLLTDNLPAEVTFVSCLSTGGGVCSGSGNNRSVTFPSLAAGSSVIVTIVGAVRSSVPGGATISNTATVSSTATDPVLGNNSATAITTVNRQADLSVTKSGSPDPVMAGNNVTYAMTVHNAGPSDAAPVTVIDNLPPEVNFVSCVSTAGGICSGSGNNRTVTLPSLAAGASATITIVGGVRSAVAGATSVSNTVVVAGPAPDPVPGNNSATAATTVGRQADVLVTQADSPDPVFVGANVTYEMTVHNGGPSDAASLALVDNLPANLNFVSCTSSNAGVCGGSANNRIVTFPSLAAGGSATITIVAATSSAIPDAATVTNTATVFSMTPDPAMANNSATVTTVATAQADVSVTNTASPNPVAAGSNVTYSIVVRNAGPSPAAAVTLQDALPAEVAFVSCSSTAGGACSGSGNTRTITFASLMSGASAVITLVATVESSVTSGTLLSNTAFVSSTTADPNLGNNFSTAATSTTVRTANCVANLAVRPKLNKAELSWTPLPGMDHYNIYRGNASGGPYGKVGQAIGPSGFFLDEGPLTTGNTYYWVVRPAQAGDTEVCQSNQATARVTGR